MAIGHQLTDCFGFPAAMDERVFVRIWARRGGLVCNEGDLNDDALHVVLVLAETLFQALPPRRRRPVSGSEAIDAVLAAVLPVDREVAFRAFRGLRPELREAPGALADYRRVARAALRSDLRKIAVAIVHDLDQRDVIFDTDSRAVKPWMTFTHFDARAPRSA